jgi:hypothetical protein
MQPWRGDRLGPVHFRPPPAPPISASAAGDRRAECSRSRTSRAGLAIGGRAAALQAAADRLAARLPKLAVERFAAPPGLELFAQDGFHPNPRAHALWGAKIAALALPLVA